MAARSMRPEMKKIELTKLWNHQEPDTLQNICLEYVVKNFAQLIMKESQTPNGTVTLEARPEIHFPVAISDMLHHKSIEMCQPIDLDLFLQCYKDPMRFPIKKLNLLQYPTLTSLELFALLSTQKVLQLDISSKRLTLDLTDIINNFSKHLLHLHFSKSLQYIFDHKSKSVSTLDCPQLLSLTIPSLYNPRTPDVLHFNFDLCFKSLVVLDLSYCKLIKGLEGILRKFERLQVLSLHDALRNSKDEFPEIMEAVGTLTHLSVLDIGASKEAQQSSQHLFFECDVNHVMKKLLDQLPSLERLELCGTNLAGERLHNIPLSARMRCQIDQPAIEWLTDRRLKYLGLFNCIDDPCFRSDIPADQVSGNANLDQLLVSLEAYHGRPKILLMVLSAVFDVVVPNQVNIPLETQATMFQLILKAMDTHPHSNDIQISGSASLFYLVKGDLRPYLTTKIKRHVVRTILDAVEDNISVISNMPRNGCLTLSHLDLPYDLLHEYRRVIQLLLGIIRQPTSGESVLVQRVGLSLINSMACQVDNEEKMMLGELGSFEIILELIEKKQEENVCDEVMEVSWSFMWNATDESPSNCQKFIENSGLVIFIKCLEKFRDKDELLRNMMGLLGNVAEVDFLRAYLIQEKFICVFVDLLDSVKDGIEVSYNACGVLANIMYDGASVWCLSHPDRQMVRKRMVKAIKRWNMRAERNINYRSFAPILKLLDCHHTPEVQLWAVWALCNLTKVYLKKYCPILRNENGLDKLAELFQMSNVKEIKKLSARVLRRCTRYIIDPSTAIEDEDDNYFSDSGGRGDVADDDDDYYSDKSDGMRNEDGGGDGGGQVDMNE
ncbi:hypothetical protein HELRODRAFT_105637 [Helobdella robusta]|uniref:Uncharacterized protein n=1 Tax=Helobdella robusta TaxID=6412 RepID=T1EDW9_HELRO|nr:hypothetical protein HELRODRAFT_105637 [Helobdella robusta]ESO12948.1 hypothetical protein HELRODRAFT_105637 [Helobdella robusta]